MLQIMLIAVGLSMDAFAVSVTSGMCVKDLRYRESLRAALFFGLFQFGMPIIGWALSLFFKSYIGGFDHWIAFILLAFIGGKMAYEALSELIKRKRGGTAAVCDLDSMKSGGIKNLGTLTLLALATSIDALAVGISLAVLGQNVFISAGVIGVVTFCLSVAGVALGRRLGSWLGEWAEILGGLILVGIGLKILLEHLLCGK